MFIPKKYSHNIDISTNTGMTIQLFDGSIELINSTTLKIPNSIEV